MKKIIEEALEFFDANRDIPTGFTTSNQYAQTRKLLEEVGEFIEAILDKDNTEAEMEAADVLSLIVDMLHVKGAEPRLDILFRLGLDKLYTPEHTAKRLARV